MDNPIRRSAAPVTEEHLDALEEHLGTPLPPDYRAFLLAHNGGVPARTTFAYTNNKGRSRTARLTWLYPLGRDGLVDAGALDLVTAHAGRPFGLPAGLLPIGDVEAEMTVGTLCIQCGGDDTGAVYFRPEVEAHRDTVFKASDSWDAFLASMTSEGGKSPKRWRESIWAGDVDALRVVLDRNTRWREDGGIQADLENEAIEEGHWPVIEYLLGTDVFDADELFRKALWANRIALAYRFLDAGLAPAGSADDLLEYLGVAAWHDTALVRRLIEAGADVNNQDECGKTPLHAAVQARAAEAVPVLLDSGANPTREDDDGRTPLQLARRLEEPAIAELLRRGEEAWKARPPEPDVGTTPFDLSGVTFTRGGPPLTLDVIRAFEAEVGFTLPPEYRWLMLQSNGGQPVPNLLPADLLPQYADEDDYGDDGEGGRVTDVKVTFFPLRKGQGPTGPNPQGGELIGDYSAEEAREWYHDGSSIPRGTLPIATLDGFGVTGDAFLLLWCKGRDRGRLVAFDHGPARLDFDLPGLFAHLAAAGARPKTPAERLSDAIAAKDLEGVRSALADCGGKVPSGTRDGRSPLELALAAGFDDAVVAMAEAGHPLGDLFAEAIGHDRITLARRLLAMGKVSNKVIRRALLGGSGVYADPDLVRELIGRGIDVKKGEHGHTLLHAAAASGHLAGVQVLVDAGADPAARSIDGRTPLHAAAGYSGLAASAAAVVRFLLSRGATWAVANESGFTPLHEAIQAGNLKACKALIDAGADLDAKFDLFIPGMSAEKQSALAQESMQAFAELTRMFGGDNADRDDDEKPPPLDTSDPTAQLLAGAMERLSGMKDQLMAQHAGRLEAFERGSLGQGPSAREWARDCDRRRRQMGQPGEALLPQLEAHAAARRGG